MIEKLSESQATATVSTDRKAQILQATVELLLERGLAATKTRAVTERSGVGTGLLNHYFRWNELRAAAWKMVFDEVAEATLSHSLPPDQAMDQYFSNAFAADAERLWRLWLEATEIAKQDEAIERVLGQAQAQMHSALCTILRSGTAAGLWTLADPEATAVRLGALNDGLAGLLLSGSPHLTRSAAEHHLRHLFLLECK